ncbi:MAG: quinolinate synthase NadA [Candidatus Omnitrophota bacterium]
MPKDAFGTTTDPELKKELVAKILRLKKERNATLVVHNYQIPEVQDIADVLGDSLALSKAVIGTGSEVVVFCGVDFMAESAKILNPAKTILLPVRQANCPMSLMATADKLRQQKAAHPDATVVCYVNSSAEVKAESDVACTSANAVKVVGALPNKKILFVPDKNLGRYVQRFFSDKEIILWPGYCPTHVYITADEVKKIKREHPGALFIAHPECPPDVLDLADHICSTTGFSPFIAKSQADTFVIGTEKGMIYNLSKRHPEKKFILASARLICPTMKMTTLGWVAHCLEKMEYRIEIPEPIRLKAEKCLIRMMEITGESPNTAIAGY